MTCWPHLLTRSFYWQKYYDISSFDGIGYSLGELLCTSSSNSERRMHTNGFKKIITWHLSFGIFFSIEKKLDIGLWEEFCPQFHWSHMDESITFCSSHREFLVYEKIGSGNHFLYGNVFHWNFVSLDNGNFFLMCTFLEKCFL